MDNKNNSKKVKNNSNNNNIQSSSLSKPKSKMTMLSFILLITIGMVLLATLISHFENEPDTDKDGSKYLKPIVCFSLVAACIYLIYKNMNDKKIFTNEIIIGISMLKKRNIDYQNYCKNTILNYMIVKNKSEKEKYLK